MIKKRLCFASFGLALCFASLWDSLSVATGLRQVRSRDWANASSFLTEKRFQSDIVKRKEFT